MVLRERGSKKSKKTSGDSSGGNLGLWAPGSVCEAPGGALGGCSGLLGGAKNIEMLFLRYRTVPAGMTVVIFLLYI